MQAQEDRHPRLRELVVAPRDEARRHGADEVQQLVGGFLVGGFAHGEGAEFEVGGGGGEEFEVGYEGVVCLGG